MMVDVSDYGTVLMKVELKVKSMAVIKDDRMALKRADAKVVMKDKKAHLWVDLKGLKDGRMVVDLVVTLAVLLDCLLVMSPRKHAEYIRSLDFHTFYHQIQRRTLT